MRSRLLAVVVGAACLVGCQAAQPEPLPSGPEPEPTGLVTTDVVYGHKDGMALTFDVYQPAVEPNGGAVISILSGGWQSSWDLLQQFVEMPDGRLRPMTAEEIPEGLGRFVAHSYAGLLERGFTVFAVRHGSAPRYGMVPIVSDMRRVVRFIRFHAGEYGVDPERVGVWGGSAGGHLALLLGTTPDDGDPNADEPYMRGSDRVAAVVAYFPPTDLERWNRGQQFPAAALEGDESREYSPIHHVSASAAPSLILHGDADRTVPIEEGRTMYQALVDAGAEAEFITIEGSDHGFAGDDATRANAAMVDWFTAHLEE